MGRQLKRGAAQEEDMQEVKVELKFIFPCTDKPLLLRV